MNFQEQIETIQAAKDGRRVTYISMYDDTVRCACTDHSFDFIRNTYTIEPLYKEGEVIMVETTRGWEPRVFNKMDSEGARCFGMAGYAPVWYTNHRKLTPAEKGGA